MKARQVWDRSWLAAACMVIAHIVFDIDQDIKRSLARSQRLHWSRLQTWLGDTLMADEWESRSINILLVGLFTWELSGGCDDSFLLSPSANGCRILSYFPMQTSKCYVRVYALWWNLTVTALRVAHLCIHCCVHPDISYNEYVIVGMLHRAFHTMLS